MVRAGEKEEKEEEAAAAEKPERYVANVPQKRGGGKDEMVRVERLGGLMCEC